MFQLSLLAADISGRLIGVGFIGFNMWLEAVRLQHFPLHIGWMYKLKVAILGSNKLSLKNFHMIF